MLLLYSELPCVVCEESLNRLYSLSRQQYAFTTPKQMRTIFE